MASRLTAQRLTSGFSIDTIIALLLGLLLGGVLPVPLFAASLPATQELAPSTLSVTTLEQRLEDGDFPLPGIGIDWTSVRTLYAARGFQPIWHKNGVVLPEMGDSLAIIATAGRHGLYPGEYHLNEIQAALDQTVTLPQDFLDILLTDGLLRYIRDIQNGRLNPRSTDPQWLIQSQPVDAPAVLLAAVESESVSRALAGLSPGYHGYQRLKELLLAYRSLANAGGWPIVPPGPKLEKGMHDQRISPLRHRLMLSGDLESFDAVDSFGFDEELELAVQRFQARHGLETDGIVGRYTLAALNVPVEERTQQILTNMERWRWLPEALGPRYLMVNMAGFDLQAVENEATVMDMRVIIGRPYRSTPAFVSEMRHLVFNPYWNVPHKLAVLDLLPSQQKDPGYFSRKGFRVFSDWSKDAYEIDPDTIDWSQYNARNFSFRLRQEPGADNSLGRIKFMMPNPYAVYLHDTPAQHLFKRAVRTFSSGCVRVEQPVRLATYLLQDGRRWSDRDVVEMIESKENRAVILPRKIPIYMLYLTAWVDDAGQVHFRDDVYGRDLLVRKAWDAVTG
jgi:murein L,D-transpeptidase YcbB/YkuD